MTIRSYMPAVPMDAKFLVEEKHPFLVRESELNAELPLMKQIIINQAIETFHRKIAEGEAMTGWKDGWCDEFEDESDIDKTQVDFRALLYDSINDYYEFMGQCSDNFEIADADANTDLWTPSYLQGSYGASMDINTTVAGKLYMNITGAPSGQETQYQLKADNGMALTDFSEVETEWEVVAGGSNNWWMIDFEVNDFDANETKIRLSRYYNIYDGQTIHATAKNDGVSQTSYKHSISNTKGKFKLTKSETTCKAFYDIGSGWVELGSWTLTGFGATVWIRCTILTGDTAPTVTAHLSYIKTGVKKGSGSLFSKAHTASAVPDKAIVTVIADDADDDHEIRVSRDGGITWTRCIMDDILEFTPGSPTRVYAGIVDLSTQPTGTSMKLKATLFDIADKIRGWDIRYL